MVPDQPISDDADLMLLNQHELRRRCRMDEDSSKTTKIVWYWAIGLNVIAWGGYFVLTRVIGITFESAH